MRIARRFSLSNRHSSTSDLLDFERQQQLGLNPENVFSAKPKSSMKMSKSNGSKKSQSLDWFQEAWKSMGDLSESASGESPLAAAQQVRSKSSRALKGTSSSKQEEGTASKSAEKVAPNNQIMSRSKSFRLKAGQQRNDGGTKNETVPVSGHSGQQLQQQQPRRQTISNVQQGNERREEHLQSKQTESYGKATPTTTTRVKDYNIDRRSSHPEASHLRNSLARTTDMRMAASNKHKSDGQHAAADARANLVRRSSISGDMRQRVNDVPLHGQDISVSPTELHLQSLVVKKQRRASINVSTVHAKSPSHNDQKQQLPIQRSIPSATLATWQKQLQSQRKPRKVRYMNECADDDHSLDFDLKSECMVSVAPEVTQRHGRVAGQPQQQQHIDEIEEHEEESNDSNSTRKKKARDHWRALTEREQKLDKVRMNARDQWFSLTAREQENIDFVLAALESTSLPVSLTKPFDWITNKELLKERLVVMAILKNESAVALLGSDYRIPKNLLGDREVILEYIQARRNVGVISEEKPSTSDKDDHSEHAMKPSRNVSLSDPKISSCLDGNKIPTPKAVKVPNNNGSSDQVSVSTTSKDSEFDDDDDESALSTAIQYYETRDDDSSLSTYHDSDSDSLPSSKDE